MKTIPRIVIMLLFVLLHMANTYAQGTSNKGKDFWTCWMNHIDGAGSQMSLYITGDISTTGTVDFADGSPSIPFSVTPNQVTVVPITSTSVYLDVAGQFKKGIHITSAQNIVVYAHIYHASRSGATLVLPVNAMGKDYYSINYTQKSNTAANNPSYSAFCVIATEDQTTIEITPTADLTNEATPHPANQSFQIVLNAGEIYQGLSLTDLTGTHIKSVSTTTEPCKKIAVYSGSSFIEIGCTPNKTTADNLFQQVYPTASWGKNYVTAPLSSRGYDIFRVILSDRTAHVLINGIAPATPLVNNFYYEFSSTVPNVITSDKPIQVVQYAVTQGSGPNCTALANDLGDPEMIYLSPIEQGLDHVTLYATNKENITKNFINVIIPSSAAASFILDNTSYTNFTPIANTINNTSYSYAQIPFGSAAGTHTISASAPFNAIAYGFGNVESYGYSAGTDIKDLNKYIVFENPQTNTDATAGCVGVTYTPQINIPYTTTSITWDLKDGTTPFTDANPVPINSVPKDGVTVYTYQSSKTAVYTTAGDYDVVATVLNPTADECGSNEDIDLSFNIADLPVVSFSKTSNSCLGSPNDFTDKTDMKGTIAKAWLWDFGDGQSATTANATHTYANPGDYPVTLTVVNENGCGITSAAQTVHISALPQASFVFSTPDCETRDITFTDKSTTAEGTITSWAWDFGDGSPVQTKTDNTPFTYKYAKAGNYTISLKVTTLAGCVSTPYPSQIIVAPLPVVDFTLPTVCLVNSTAQFTDKTTITGTTGTPFKYAWDFGDPANATPANPDNSALANPTHQFTTAGVYHVSLTVTSNDGCGVTTIKDYTVSGQANFTAPATACPADVVTFTDNTDATKTVATAWHWDFGDGNTADVQNPTHAFTNSRDYTVTLTVTGNNGCSTTSFSRPIHINASPVADFSATTPDCETQAVTFTDKSSPGEGTLTTWLWDFGDGSTPVTNTTNASVTHIFATANTYNVSLTVTSSTSCVSAVKTVPVIIHPLPVVDFTLPDVCLNDASAQFTDKSTIADNSEGQFTWSWNFGDPYATAANNVSSAKNPAHKYTQVRDASNPYIVTLTVKSGNGCSVTKSQPFVVNGDTPKAAFSVENANNLCSSEDVIFDDLSSVNFGNVTKLVWYFDFTNHPTDATVYTKDQFPADRKFHHNYGLFYTPASQNYAVKLEAYSGGTCVNTSAVQNIAVKANPSVTLSQIGTICQEDGPVQITETPNNGFTGTGTFSGTGISSTGLFDPSVSGSGNFTINYTFVASNGCDYSTSQQVTVNPTPKADAGDDLHVLQGGGLTINATASGVEPLKYKWTLANGSPATGLDHDDVLNPVASPADDVTYMLTVTSAEGCIASDNVDVFVLKAPEVPNTFTPNNDGINDKWEIKYLETYPNCSIDVYNRYGEKLYSSIGYPTPWDGSFKGAPLPVGTYYYIINPKNGRKVITGSVTIIR